MARYCSTIVVAACAAALLASTASAAVMQIRFDSTTDSTGFGGDLKQFESVTVSLPTADGTLHQQLQVNLTGSTQPVARVQLFVVEFVSDPLYFLPDWDDFHAYDALPLPSLGANVDVRFSASEKYFVVSNQVQDAVVDLAGLGLGSPLAWMRITDVTRSFRPLNETRSDRVYAQDLFAPKYALKDYVLEPSTGLAGDGVKHSEEVTLLVIPEPATGLLALAGLLVLGRRRGRDQ